MYTACFGHFLSHFNMLAFPAVVLPLTGVLDMSMSGVLGLSFWMYLFFGVSALPWGIAADRYGASVFFLIFYLGAGVCGLAAGVFISSPGALMLSLAGIGIFSGIYHPVGLGMISKEMRQVSLGMGFNGMFGNIGMAMAPLLMGLANWLSGPRAGYFLLGALNLAGAVVMMRYPPDLRHARQPSSGRSGDGGAAGAFLILLGAMMLGGVVYTGGTVILPAYFELRNQGMLEGVQELFGSAVSGNLVATLTTSIIFVTGIFGQYVGGHLAERYEPKYVYLAFHLSAIPAAFLAALTSNLALVGVVMAYFFFLLGMQPSENTLVAALAPKRLHHSAFGFKFILTFGVGALAVKMVGAVESSFGLSLVFPFLGGVSVLLVLFILALLPRAPDIRRNGRREAADTGQAGT